VSEIDENVRRLGERVRALTAEIEEEVPVVVAATERTRRRVVSLVPAVPGTHVVTLETGVAGVARGIRTVIRGVVALALVETRVSLTDEVGGAESHRAEVLPVLATRIGSEGTPDRDPLGLPDGRWTWRLVTSLADAHELARNPGSRFGDGVAGVLVPDGGRDVARSDRQDQP